MIEESQPLSIILEQIIVDFLTLLPSLIAALVLFVVGLFLASIIRRLVRRGLSPPPHEPAPTRRGLPCRPCPRGI